MSRSNQKPVSPKTHEGAPARIINAKDQLRRSVMACMLWENEFYEDGVNIASRIHSVANQCSVEFVSQLAIEARKEHGLRHAPLWLALSLVPRGGKIVSKTLYEVISRADELTEVLAMYWKDKRKPISAQLKLGLAKAFTKFDEYQLAKYNRKNEVKLKDVARLVHPVPKDKVQAEVFKRLIADELKTPDTWEVALSGGADKKETFERLLSKRKLGYLALLKNLRNMRDAGVDSNVIYESLKTGNRRGILPFQYISAARAVPQYENMLDEVMQLTMQEMPRLKGKTVLLVDNSQSMNWALSERSTLNRRDAAGALAVLLRGICEEVEVFSFSNTTKLVPPRNGMALIDAIQSATQVLGTRLGQSVTEVNRIESDRLIVITDEQSHDRVPNPNTKGYMINVASNKNGVGYGPWLHIDGFSEKIVDYVVAYEA